MRAKIGRVSRSARRAVALVVLVLAAAPVASASTPSVDVHSAGPLSDIYIGNDLSCQVRSGGFSSTEYFPNASGPGDCGTFLAVNGEESRALFGPDFADHVGGTHTTGNFAHNEVPYTPVSQSFTGSGTASSPYRVTTVTSGVHGRLSLTFTEIDTYVVGNSFFQTDVTVSNTSRWASLYGKLYHAADCLLRGSDSGFGAAEPPSAPNTGACTVNALGSPASALEEFVPLTARSGWIETASPRIWSILNGRRFGDTCFGCNTFENNAQGIEWWVSLRAGQSQTFSFQTKIVDTIPTGGVSLSGTAGASTSGTVATITDPNTSATVGAFSTTINWGDGTTSPGTITGGNGSFNVVGTHAYATTGTYPVAVTITAVGSSQGSSTVNDSATVTSPPSPVVPSQPPAVGGITAASLGGTTAAFTGSVNPSGLSTTAFFEYGLDPKYTGSGPLAYTQSTLPQLVGADVSIHVISASVTGLVPNALYHVRLVAVNSAGTTVGPDFTFTTPKTAPPAPPTIGKTFNISPVSGVVLILLHGQLVPLTETQQIPASTLIDALHGTLKLTTAAPGRSGAAADAAAKAKKPKKAHTQSGTFGGAIFKIAQAHNGLATLTIVENAFKGAPSYATCRPRKSGDATMAAASSSRTLQLLHASAKGKFRTRGRYSAATVRGTIWTVADRCDGTLTHDITDSVAVIDFVRHKTIVLHHGQRYLAAARRSGRRS